MSMVDILKGELAHEAATTRAMLALVPADKKDWKPHAKSMALGALAMHLAEMPTWTPSILLEPSFDIAPPGAPPYKTPEFTTAEHAVAAFNEGIAKATAALGRISDASLGETWRFLAGGKELMAMPRIAALRTWVLNHSVHHRAQLGVYLRLLDIPLPGSYGPTADKQSM